MPDFNRILYKLSRYSGYLLFILLTLYFITGLGRVKGFLDPVLAKNIHERWLFFPTLVLVLFHSFYCFKTALQKRIKDQMWVDVYLIIFVLVLLAVSSYLYFL